MTTTDLLSRFYFSDPTFKDGTHEFHSLIGGFVKPESNVVEIGSGPDNVTTAFLSSITPVIGVDVSEEIYSNRHLSRAIVYDGSRLPFEDASINTITSNYVLEHIDNPELHFIEVARVLAPGGVYVFRTPNLFHYVALASLIVPHRWHRIANRLRALPGSAHEPWPTRYRANTVRRIRSLAKKAGLSIASLRTIEKEPCYGMAHPSLMVPMIAYERMVNSTRYFAHLRANIFCALFRSLISTKV